MVVIHSGHRLITKLSLQTLMKPGQEHTVPPVCPVQPGEPGPLTGP